MRREPNLAEKIRGVCIEFNAYIDTTLREIERRYRAHLLFINNPQNNAVVVDKAQNGVYDLYNYIKDSLLDKELSLLGVSEADYYREYDRLIEGVVSRILRNNSEETLVIPMNHLQQPQTMVSHKGKTYIVPITITSKFE